MFRARFRACLSFLERGVVMKFKSEVRWLKTLTIALFMFWSHLALAATISVTFSENPPFGKGFVGTIGANTGQADSIITFGTLGITEATFSQNSSTDKFEIQGNDIPGTLILKTSSQTLQFEGFMNWLKQGNGCSGTCLVGFIINDDEAAQTLNYSSSSYTFDTVKSGTKYSGTNIAVMLDGYSPAPSWVDGDDVAGSANNKSVLDALNTYLDVQTGSGASLATTKSLTKVNGATPPTNYLVSSGDVLEYTVSVANTGGQSGTTTLTETVPTNTSYSGSSEGWAVASGNYTQDVTVAAGATVTKTFTVTVGTLGDGVLSIANTVASSSGSCSSCTVTNATDPRLSISKSVPSSLPVGGTGSYTITLTNNGGSATSGAVTFTDTLPTGLSFNAQTAGASVLGCTAAGQVVTCTGSSAIAAAGTASVTYSVDVAGSASGTLINDVLLTALGGDPRTPADDASNPTAGNATQGSDKLSAKSAQSVTSGASLATTKSLTKVNGATPPTNYLVSSGDVLEYTVSVANTGGQSGTTTLTETVPTNTSYSGSSEGWAVASGNYTQDVTVAAGATVTKTFTVTVGTLGDGVLSIANTVASSSGSCSSCTVTNATDPRLSISKSVPSSLPVGGTGSYTITLTNNGGSATSGAVTFTDTLPTGLSFNAQTAGALSARVYGGWASCDVYGQFSDCGSGDCIGDL